MKLIWPMIAFLLCIAAITFAWLWWHAAADLAHLEREVSNPFDQAFETAAYREAARYENQPIEKMKSYFRPLTMTYRDKKCVELRPRWHVYGGHTIYCYSLDNGALVHKEIIPG
ncbi:hypothetical protein [Sphingobium sp. Ant17]|uniref:hypothetical protein n=1 Tax=Sphingobium sp. Ant17 TaxID=1461752 RepID=UPI001268FA4E|nr:hypothetical protein [Sphingobium sp. Ant17]